jgi:hypothetical protein
MMNDAAIGSATSGAWIGYGTTTRKRITLFANNADACRISPPPQRQPVRHTAIMRRRHGTLALASI